LRKLCFLSPDYAHARRVVQDLREYGIDEQNLYVIAKSHEPLDDLPDDGGEADDFIPALERGVAFGGLTGLFVGLLAVAFPPSGMVLGGGALLVISAMSASVGGLLSAVAGASFPNSRLAVFAEAIEAGQILVMADIPLEQIHEVAALIQKHDPAVEVEGIEPAAPVIP